MPGGCGLGKQDRRGGGARVEGPSEVGGDASSSENEGGREVVATSVGRREPTTASVGGGRDAKRHSDVPASRKRAASSDAVAERGAKWTRLPRPSKASSVLPPLLQAWRGRPVGQRSELAPAHLRGQRRRATHNGGMPCQLLRWAHHEPAVVATHGLIGSQPGLLPPRSK